MWKKRILRSPGRSDEPYVHRVQGAGDARLLPDVRARPQGECLTLIGDIHASCLLTRWDGTEQVQAEAGEFLPLYPQGQEYPPLIENHATVLTDPFLSVLLKQRLYELCQALKLSFITGDAANGNPEERRGLLDSRPYHR